MSITTLYHLTVWISALLDGIWIIALLNRLAGRKLRDSYLHYLIFLLPIALATCFFYRWQRYDRPLAILVLVGLVVILCLYAVGISNRQWKKALVSVGIAVLTVVSVTGMLIACFMMAGRYSILGDLVGAVYRVATAYYIAHSIVSTLIFILLCLFFGKNTAYVLKKGILLFLFTLSGIISVSVLVWSVLCDWNFSLATAVVPLVLTNLCLIALYLYLQKQRQGSYEARLFAEKKRFEENRYNDASAIWENVRKVQHDIKQHLTVINGYLSEGKTEECREYLSTLLPNVECMGNLIQSDNRILDYLINSKLCALENTQVVISGAVGDLSDIADADLACLMGNILDNAIEGTANAEEKRIELHFSRQNSNRIIICKNTIAKSVLEGNRTLKSTKSQGDAHGYGTKIIAEIVEKYHGMIDYYEEFDLFGVQIILPVQK